MDLILELGGSNISIYKKNRGLIFVEPSLIAVAQINGEYEVKGFGEDAKTLASIEDPNVSVFSPFSAGKIKNFEYAQLLLSLSLKKAGIKKSVIKQKTILITNCGFNFEDKVNFSRLLSTCGLELSFAVPSVFGIAFSDGLLEFSNKNILVCDIGSGVTSVAVLNMSKIMYGSSITLGGKDMTIGVLKMINEKYSLQVSFFTAEKVKEELASLAIYDSSTIDVKGLDISSKEERIVTIKANDVRSVISLYFLEILKQVENILNLCADDVLKQIKLYGFLLGGQTCKTIGVEQFFKQNTSLQTHIVDDEKNACILGIAKIMKNNDLLKKISFE